MLNKLLDELSTGWIWAGIPIIIMWLWKVYQQRFKKRYTKVVVFKVMRLRLKSLGHSPYYLRKHHSLEGIEEPVYDETWMSNITIVNQSTLLDPISISSYGFVDVYQILPSFTISKDIHPHRSMNPKLFEFREDSPARSIGVMGVLANGLQEEKAWWYGATAQYNEQEITLIVDFSSIPNASNLIKQLTAVRESRQPKGNGKVSENPLAINQISQDIFAVSQENCKIDDVLRIKFQLDTDELKND